MKLENKCLCPLAGFAECRRLDCALFLQVRGTHPQTGQEVDEYGCALAWTPLLLIETSKEVRQGAAATESLRNEIVRQASANRALVLARQPGALRAILEETK